MGRGGNERHVKFSENSFFYSTLFVKDALKIRGMPFSFNALFLPKKHDVE